MSNIHTPTKRILSKESIKPTSVSAHTGATTGVAVDCLGARVAMLDVSANISAGNTTFTVDESSDNSSWTADIFSAKEFAVVISSAATGTQINAPGHQVMSIDLAKRKRYLRVVATDSGVTGAICARFLLVNETTLYDATTGNADSQDNPDIVN